MASYSVECTSNGVSTKLQLCDGGIFSFPTWRCLDGKEMWGNPFEGDCLSPRLTGGSVELSFGTYLFDWSVNTGHTGEGLRNDLSEGEFPTGSFSWGVL